MSFLLQPVTRTGRKVPQIRREGYPTDDEYREDGDDDG
jgi:hypothetical protein